MPQTDNSLDKGYDQTSYSSSLEAPVDVQVRPMTSAVVPSSALSRLSLFRYNRTAVSVTITAILLMLVVGIGAFLLTGLHTGNQAGSGGQQATNYAVGNVSVQGVKSNQQLQIGEADHLAINGQLQVSNTLVLTPTDTPT